MRWFFLAVFIDGFGVPEDKEQGIKLIREAAEKEMRHLCLPLVNAI